MTKIKNVGHAIDTYADETLVTKILAAIRRRMDTEDDAQAVYAELRRWAFALNYRANTRFGVCKLAQRKIEVNYLLLHHPKDFYNTLVHEIAHALDWILSAGTSAGHGRSWQYLMIDLGQKPVTCGDHSDAARDALNAARHRQAKEIWVCQRCRAETPIIRKRKYPADAYSHPGCGGRFMVKVD